MLNKALYELLPFIYLVTGALIGTLLESPVRYLPALLLIAAGSMVLNWRRKARRAVAQGGGIKRAEPRRRPSAMRRSDRR